MHRALLAAAVLCSIPLASASGTLESPAMRIEIENGQDAACLDPGPFCLATTKKDAEGRTSIDIYQSVEHITVHVDPNGTSPLPTYRLVFNASSLRGSQPVLRILTETLPDVEDPTGDERFWLRLRPTGIYFGYFGPTLHNITSGNGPREGGFEYSRSVGYEEFGGFNELGGSSTHVWMDDVHWGGCHAFQNTTDCEAHAEPLFGVAKKSPDVRFGLEFYEARALAGNVSTATGEDRIPIRAPLAGRIPVPAPAPMPESELPGTRALPSEGHARPGPWSPHPLGRPALPDARAPPEARPPSIDERGGSWPPVLAATAAALALALLLAALYSRITRADAAASAPRQRILAALQEGPQRVASLASALGFDRTTVEHHVRVLVKTGHVTLARVGRALFVALPGQSVEQSAVAGPARAETLVLRALEASQGALPRPALHAALQELPLRTRNQAIMALARKGMLRSEWDGHVETVRIIPRDGVGA